MNTESYNPLIGEYPLHAVQGDRNANRTDIAPALPEFTNRRDGPLKQDAKYA